MDDMNGDISHTLSITSMQQPAEGFFPTRVGAEVKDERDRFPMYTTSTYAQMWSASEYVRI